MDISHAINALIPVGSASWVLHGNDYSGLDWHSDNELPKPTESEVNAKLAELMAAEPMRLLRIERDKLLAECDWVTIRSYNQGVPVPEEWVEYCQALRDLPETSTPVLDSSTRIGISGVTWPTKPS